LDAALYNFDFHMAVEGTVTYEKTQESYGGLGSDEDVYTVRITRVGLYVRDSFDFIGDQDLGYWNPKTNDVAKTWLGAGDGYHEVTNAGMRQWRKKTGCGGDFLVFSDMEIRNVNESWTVEIDVK